MVEDSMDDASLVRVLKALGDPKRFRMVQELAAAGELTCGELVDRFPLSQATVSHHMKLLVDAGAVVMREEGQSHFFSVNSLLLGTLGPLLQRRLAPRAPPKGPKRRATRG